MKPYLLQFGIFIIYNAFFTVIMYSHGKPPRHEDSAILTMMALFILCAHIAVTILFVCTKDLNYHYLIAIGICLLIRLILLQFFNF